MILDVDLLEPLFLSNDHVLPGFIVKFLIIVVTKPTPDDDCFYWQEMRWQIKTSCFPLRIAVSCDTGLFETQVEVTDLIQALATVRWTLVILDGMHATVPFLFNIDKDTNASFPHSILDLFIHSQYSFDKNFQTEKPVGIGAFVWLWLIHNWLIGLVTDPKCFRRLFFLASMSGVSLPWHNVPMSGWRRSGLSWSQRCM